MPGTGSILVAEDNDDDAFLLQRTFIRAGIDVRIDVVCDGEETIDYLKGKGRFGNRSKHPIPKLLVLDLKMPRLNGFDVLKWLRSDPKLKRLPVTVLSSSDEMVDVNKAFDLGANSYVVKPSDLNDLTSIAAKLHEYWLRTNACPECTFSDDN